MAKVATTAPPRDGAVRSDVFTGATPPRARAAGPLDRFLLRLLERALQGTGIRLQLWDGTLAGPAIDTVGTVAIADRATLLRLVWNPEMGFGDGWSAGRLSVSGDLITLLEALYWSPRFRSPSARSSRLPNTRRRAWRRIHHHYDLGNDFYRLWLDAEMLYTCAYFPEPDLTLEAAQVAKMEHVCRKLGLSPGDRVVEAGCGWGALAMHMAAHHGVTVRAFNISSEQIRFARARARERGLDARVEFVEEDYRGIDGSCDVFVSIGMLEHVGLDGYAELGRILGRVLDARRGRGLLHFIGRNEPHPLSEWVERRIFPGAYPPTLGEAVRGVLEPAGVAVLDVENLRSHYVRTLDHWLQRFDAAGDRIAAMYGDAFVRAWRLYLAGSLASFSTGTLQLFQVLFARGGADGLAWTGRGRYADGGDR